MIRRVLAGVALGLVPMTAAAQAVDAQAMAHSVEQLRSTIGRWDVVTEFLNEDGTVAKAVNGSYEFSWVVPDRVVAGRSDMPELKRTAGILFYVNLAKRHIEMVSVGGDGMLWIMTGPLGGEVRTTQAFKTAKGEGGRLRFTRFNVSGNAFESRMEYTEDGGETWKPGNRQRFRRGGQPPR